MHGSTQQPRTWLAIGVRALDTAQNRVGVAQLFRDKLGWINADQPIERATHVLLRPVGRDHQPPGWARIGDLQQPRGSAR
jgi:hypothetical protein